MSQTLPEHVDETGAPCPRHAQISRAALYQLAMVGSRASAFHHDCASKLQGLVMALDELSELGGHGDPQVRRAIETAIEASRDLSALLGVNRALTRPALRAAIALRELVARGAERVGVAVHGELPSASVSVGAAPMTHALALAVDAAAGTGRGRSLAVSAEVATDGVDLALHASPLQAPGAGDALAIAGFVVERDGGRLWCASSGNRVVIRLPWR